MIQLFKKKQVFEGQQFFTISIY